MAEWLKAHAWKACLLERATWARIALSPPALVFCCRNRGRFCQVVVSANGRTKPDCVIVAGKPELHREGAYYIEWYEKGTRRRRSVGKNAIEAHTEQQRQIQLLRNEALGIEVVQEKEP